ncbi:MAG TPA: NAD-dependent epimerase/dehydratase family protein [Alphaproteobacteria bacterium]|jgi:UDP-glucuronate 4-epimerase|nr:NAD-dependent epimerase/dehydratase family protein [Alphaproteobacteria bacterium]
MTVVVTGAAGFIGFHVASALLARGERVVGIDVVNDYYDPRLKESRLARLGENADFSFHRADIADHERLFEILAASGPLTGVIHLAAQAGVRYSLKNPYAYVHSNLLGQVAMFEAVRRLDPLPSFVYASSSSVYGGNDKFPFAVADRVDHPVSLYAATKRGGELLAESYAAMYGLPSTGLRFFTVYGPWGRPDMAYFSFTKAILAGEAIPVFNEGKLKRDFTYIDDIVAGVIAALDLPADPARRHRLYNLGNNKSEPVLHFIKVLEKALDRKAIIRFEPMQPGDVEVTAAEIEDSRRELGFKPITTIEQGLPRFVAWYKDYYGAGA